MKFYKNKHPEYQFTTELVELNCHCVGEDGSVYEYQAIEWEENSNEGILVHVVEYEELEDAVKDYKQIEQEIWSVAGVLQLFDVTKDTMIRYQLVPTIAHEKLEVTDK